MSLIKICGLTRKEDVQLAAKLGANFAGFIFAKKSPRYITKEQCAKISKNLPNSIRKVGVFVNEKPQTINDICQRCQLDVVQLHGAESAEILTKLNIDIIWKALPLRTPQEFEYAKNFPANAILVDSIHNGEFGGTGKKCNWATAAKFAKLAPLILAGGITPQNIIAAYHEVKPFIIDLSSGVESCAGIKNHDKMYKLFNKINSIKE